MVVLKKIVKWLIKKLKEAIYGKPDPHKYKAKFVKETYLLSKRKKGFCLTGKRNLSIKDSYQNALVIGGTGTGKSSTVLLPSLYKMEGSLVIHDPSGELYQKSAGLLFKKGYTIKRLNFTNEKLSIGFNPLKRIDTNSGADKLASMLVYTTLGRSGEQFWNLQGVSLIANLIKLLLSQPLMFRTLKSVHALLQSLLANPDKVTSFVEKHGSLEIKRAYYAFLGLEDKLRTNIIATALATLTHMNDEVITKVTNVDTFNMESLRKQKIALFVQNPLTEQSYLSSLTSIFFEQLWKMLLDTIPQKQDLDVFFLIDEASSLYLPSLSNTIANVRKYKAGIMLVLQNFNQLVHLYGQAQADTILSNCFAKLYFSGQPLGTAKELEATLGKYEYKDNTGRKFIRPLMTASEIRMMNQKNAILLAGHHPPLKVKLIPYYKERKWRKASTLMPPEAKPEVPSTIIYLNL